MTANLGQEYWPIQLTRAIRIRQVQPAISLVRTQIESRMDRTTRIFCPLETPTS